MELDDRMEYRVEKNLFKNKRCFIIGTGTSLDDVNMSLFDNEITIGINLILKHPTFIPNYLVVGDTQVLKNHYHDIFSDKMNNGMYVLGNSCLLTGKGNCTDGPGSTCYGIPLDPKYKNIYSLEHWEKSEIFINHIADDRSKLLKTGEYYIDWEFFQWFTSYGASTVDNLAIPLAVYLGFKNIYLLGCDAGWDHFYDVNRREGKREWINFNHVIKELDKFDMNLVNCDRTNVFPELKYKNLEYVIEYLEEDVNEIN